MRKLTVSEHGDAYRQKIGKESPKTKITIAGNWLYEAGFHKGDLVNITVEEDQILIRKEQHGTA